MNVRANNNDYLVRDSSDLSSLSAKVGDLALSMGEKTAYVFDGTNWLDTASFLKIKPIGYTSKELSINNVF